jgi:hypothetical protein
LYDGNGWVPQVLDSPELLNFWFDFLDSEGELSQFSIKQVGDRVKAVNDNTITAIYFKEVPDLIFVTAEEYTNKGLASKGGYTAVIINGTLENMFRISAQGKSAQDVIDELIYNHSYCIESVTI